MITIIAGTRRLDKVHTLKALELCPWTNEISRVLSGGASGPDRHGAEWAVEHGIPVNFCLPQYHVYGPRIAPVMRNTEMAKKAEAAILVIDRYKFEHDQSRGSTDMLHKAQLYNLKLFVYMVEYSIYSDRIVNV